MTVVGCATTLSRTGAEQLASALISPGSLELASQDPSQHKELAIAENVSAGGMRVSLEHVWVTGEDVQLSSPESGFRTEARVVYCQRLENNKFAVGLELFAPLEAPLKE